MKTLYTLRVDVVETDEGNAVEKKLKLGDCSIMDMFVIYSETQLLLRKLEVAMDRAVNSAQGQGSKHGRIELN